jgi:hypothetical protein
MAIQDRAINVLATIQGDLPGTTPIVFVCHSYGGLLVKQMLSTSLGRAHNEYGLLAGRIKGIVFLSTPHNGSRIADYVNAMRIVLRSSAAIAELKQNAPHLRELGGWFRNNALSRDWKTRVFFETLNTLGVRVVDEDSADPHIANITPIGIDADHNDICKPPRPDVRLTQTNALIREILQAFSPPKGITNELSPLARLIAAKNLEEFERLRKRFEMQLKGDPTNKELIDALSSYSMTFPESTPLSAPKAIGHRGDRLVSIYIAAVFGAAGGILLFFEWSRIGPALLTVYEFMKRLF